MHSKSPGYTKPSLGRDDGDIRTGLASSCLATDRSHSTGKQWTHDGLPDRSDAGDQRWRVGRLCISARMRSADRLAPIALLTLSVGSGMASSLAGRCSSSELNSGGRVPVNLHNSGDW